MPDPVGRVDYRLTLSQPYFKRLLTARVVSNFGNGMAPTALAFAVLGLPNGNAAALSVVLTAQAVPLVIFLPIGGVIADRVGRARMIAGSDVLLGSLLLLVAYLFAAGDVRLPVLAAIMALTGILNAMWWPAYPGLPADLVQDEHLQTANSLISFGSNSAMIFGAAAGGWLVSTAGSAFAIATDAATFVIAGALVWTFRHTSKSTEPTASMWHELREGWQVFWSFKWVVVVVAAFMFIVLATRATEGVLGPLVARNYFDGAASWAQVTAAEGVGFLLGAILGGRWRPQHPMVAGMLVCLPAAGFMLALAGPAPLPVIMLSAAAWGVGIETLVVWWFTAIQEHIPREAIGRVSAYDGFGSTLFGPIGLALAGPLADNFGTRLPLVGGAVVVVVAILLSLTNSELRSLRSAGPAAARA